MKKSPKKPDLSSLSAEERAEYYKRKLASYMGLAAKAGKIAAGTNTCIFTMAKGKARLLIISEDLAENGRDTVWTRHFDLYGSDR